MTVYNIDVMMRSQNPQFTEVVWIPSNGQHINKNRPDFLYLYPTFVYSLMFGESNMNEHEID